LKTPSGDHPTTAPAAGPEADASQAAVRGRLQTVFAGKSWAGDGRAPRSGRGSSLEKTARLRAALPGIFARYGVTRFVDAPCGDWTWMPETDISGVEYLGADIVPELVAANAAAHSRDGVRFEVLDITSSPLPPSDLFMCRDCLFHLKFWLRWAFFENFAASDGKYLMTTVDHVHRNRRLRRNGDFYRFDPRLAPFNLPEPLELVPENHETIPPDHAADPARSKKYRSMGIWSIDQIRAAVAARPNRND